MIVLLLLEQGKGKGEEEPLRHFKVFDAAATLQVPIYL